MDVEGAGREPQTLSPHKVAVVGTGKLGIRIAGELRVQSSQLARSRKGVELVRRHCPCAVYTCRGAGAVRVYCTHTRPQPSQSTDSTLQNSRGP